MAPISVGCVLALLLFLGLGPGAISFAEETAEHWLVGGWEDQETGAVVKITAVQRDGTALGTMASRFDIQRQAEIKVEGSRVRVVYTSGAVLEATRGPAGDLSGALRQSDGTVLPVTLTRMQPCTEPTPVDARPYGPPRYCVGDTWSFSYGGVQKVVSVGSDTVVMTGTTTPGISCPGCLVTFDGNLALRSITQANGKPLEVSNISRDYVPAGDGWRYWDFPLTVGKIWGFSGKAFGYGFRSNVKNFSARCKVEAYEDVTVAAGTFKAFKISRTWNRYEPQVESFNYSEVLWFAPAVKTTVKYKVLPFGTSWELNSYRLTDFSASSRRH